MNQALSQDHHQKFIKLTNHLFGKIAIFKQSQSTLSDTEKRLLSNLISPSKESLYKMYSIEEKSQKLSTSALNALDFYFENPNSSFRGQFNFLTPLEKFHFLASFRENLSRQTGLFKDDLLLPFLPLTPSNQDQKSPPLETPAASLYTIYRFLPSFYHDLQTLSAPPLASSPPKNNLLFRDINGNFTISLSEENLKTLISLKQNGSSEAEIKSLLPSLSNLQFSPSQNLYPFLNFSFTPNPLDQNSISLSDLQDYYLKQKQLSPFHSLEKASNFNLISPFGQNFDLYSGDKLLKKVSGGYFNLDKTKHHGLTVITDQRDSKSFLISYNTDFVDQITTISIYQSEQSPSSNQFFNLSNSPFVLHIENFNLTAKATISDPIRASQDPDNFKSFNFPNLPFKKDESPPSPSKYNNALSSPSQTLLQSSTALQNKSLLPQTLIKPMTFPFKTSSKSYPSVFIPPKSNLKPFPNQNAASSQNLNISSQNPSAVNPNSTLPTKPKSHPTPSNPQNKNNTQKETKTSSSSRPPSSVNPLYWYLASFGGSGLTISSVTILNLTHQTSSSKQSNSSSSKNYLVEEYLKQILPEASKLSLQTLESVMLPPPSLHLPI